MSDEGKSKRHNQYWVNLVEHFHKLPRFDGSPVLDWDNDYEKLAIARIMRERWEQNWKEFNEESE